MIKKLCVRDFERDSFMLHHTAKKGLTQEAFGIASLVYA